MLIADTNILFDAMKASMKGSSWKKEPQKYYHNWLTELQELKEELVNQTYKTSPCTEFTLNERGKTRHIHGNRMRDRIVRHALCDEILTPCLAKYIIPNNCASRKGMGISKQRENFEKDLRNYYLKHGNNKGYIGFVDLSKFYDNIPHEKIKELIYPLIPKDTHWLMDEIIKNFAVDVSYMSDEEYNNCLNKKFDSIEYYKTIPKELRTGEKMMEKSCNIGDQVSQSIGIFYPTRIDNKCKIVLGLKYYGRYMDDIYFITETKEQAKAVIKEIKKSSDELGLFINEKKTQIAKLSEKFKFLQIRYSLTDNGKIIKRVNPKTVTKERQRLKAYKKLCDNNIVPYEDIENAYKSWMGNYVKLMSKKQRKNMKELYKALFGKDVRWKKLKSSSKTVA